MYIQYTVMPRNTLFVGFRWSFQCFMANLYHQHHHHHRHHHRRHHHHLLLHHHRHHLVVYYIIIYKLYIYILCNYMSVFIFIYILSKYNNTPSTKLRHHKGKIGTSTSEKSRYFRYFPGRGKRSFIQFNHGEKKICQFFPGKFHA